MTRSRASTTLSIQFLIILLSFIANVTAAEEKSPGHYSLNTDAAISAAQARARETESKMTDDERFDMIYSLMVFALKPDFTSYRDQRVPAGVPQLAGWVKGVKRLGVPDLLLTDAGLGYMRRQNAGV